MLSAESVCFDSPKLGLQWKEETKFKPKEVACMSLWSLGLSLSISDRYYPVSITRSWVPRLSSPG